MNNRYKIMKQLRDRLGELFQLCGISANPVDIRPAPALIRLAENLTRDESLHVYLHNLYNQTGQAIQVMKERQLDVWNNEQNEIRIQELEQQLEQEQRQMAELEENLAQEHLHTAELEKELEQLKISPFAESVSTEQETTDRQRQEQLALVKDIISMRDKLLLRMNWIEEQAPEEKNARKVVESQLRETARCLENAGVEILDAPGSFDSSCHTVIETRPAEIPDQIDQIAETFRPGYRFQGEILRSQEVILYVKP